MENADGLRAPCICFIGCRPRDKGGQGKRSVIKRLRTCPERASLRWLADKQVAKKCPFTLPSQSASPASITTLEPLRNQHVGLLSCNAYLRVRSVCLIPDTTPPRLIGALAARDFDRAPRRLSASSSRNRGKARFAATFPDRSSPGVKGTAEVDADRHCHNVIAGVDNFRRTP